MVGGQWVASEQHALQNVRFVAREADVHKVMYTKRNLPGRKFALPDNSIEMEKDRPSYPQLVSLVPPVSVCFVVFKNAVFRRRSDN